MATHRGSSPPISQRITAALRDADQSQHWLANATGIPLTTRRRRLVSAGDSFTLDELARIAVALDVDFLHLVAA